ncbi:DsbA family protein [Streptomyces wedmorensis]
MPARRPRRAVAALVVTGSIGLAAVGCSGGGEPSASAAAAVTVAPAEHTDVLSALPETVDGTKIVVASEKAFEESGVGGTPTVLVDGAPLPGGDALYDAAEFSKALRDAGL